MEFLNDYLVAVVVGICLCIGYVLKHAIPSDKINRFIPLLMLVLGTIVNVWLHDFTLSPEILLGGMASGLASSKMEVNCARFTVGTRLRVAGSSTYSIP